MNTKLKFKKIDDIIKDDYFIERVGCRLHLLLQQRCNRPAPPKGKKYLRDWHDRMSESCMLNVRFFISHIKDIWEKKSNLNREERNVILIICNNAFQDTLQYYIDKEKQETETTTPE